MGIGEFAHYPGPDVSETTNNFTIRGQEFPRDSYLVTSSNA